MSLRHSLSTHLKAFEKKFETLNRIEISRAALLHNFDLFTELSPGHQVIVVAKANAYGLGLEAVTEILKERSFPYIAVDGYFEALTVREVSSQPILIMGWIKPENIPNIDCDQFSFVVHDELTLRALGETKKRVKIHCELETGMNRYGVPEKELPAFLELLHSYSNLQLEGVMTHLADADNPDTAFTDLQTQRFDQGVEAIQAAGFSPSLIHIAQTAGSAKVLSKYANTLRVGRGIYGISSLVATDPTAAKLQDLRPAMTIISTVSKILTLPADSPVGYGCTFVTQHPSLIGVLPIGYYEGLPRALGNTGIVQWRGQDLPITGRVCMNHTMIDLTNTTAKVGDEVIILSPNPTDHNSIASLVSAQGLFACEIMVGINQNVRRVIV